MPQRSRSRATPLLLALAALACGPRIQRFEVTPPSVCAGDPAPVGRWQARGELALQVSVDDAGGGAPEARARLAQLPPGSRLLTLRLTSSSGGVEKDAETRTVEQLPDRFETEVAFPAAPAPGGAVAAGSKNPARWGDRFEVAGVAAADGRALVVQHGGRTAAVGPAPTAAFDGTALEGPWELRWTAGSGAAPAALGVKVTVRCKGRP